MTSRQPLDNPQPTPREPAHAPVEAGSALALDQCVLGGLQSPVELQCEELAIVPPIDIEFLRRYAVAMRAFEHSLDRGEFDRNSFPTDRSLKAARAAADEFLPRTERMRATRLMRSFPSWSDAFRELTAEDDMSPPRESDEE